MFVFSPNELKQRRAAADLSREALAVRLGRGYQSIRLYEAGIVQPPTPVVARMASILGCEPGDFFKEIEPVPA
jgi:transcriptional regulator with XRE-family HTH domain